MPTNLQIHHACDEQLQMDVFVPETGARYDLSLISKAWFTVKDDLTDLDASALLAKTLSSGIAIQAPSTDGILVISIAAADTSGFTVAQCEQNFFWDLKIKETSGGKIRRLNYGMLKILVNPTLAVS